MKYRGLIPSFLTAALVALACAACDQPVRANAQQIAAKVNGSEISVQQVASVTAARGRSSAEARQAAVQALDRIIDRELLVQKALESKIDRDPAVAQAMENARRQLLAQAYLERTAAASAAKSTPDEVRAFYADNPALFAQRRIYRLREIALAAPVERIDLLKAEAAQAKELDDVAGWLHSRGEKFTITSSTQPAEQLPLSHLPQLARMKEGEIAVLGSAIGASVIQLVHAQDAGLSEPQAAPLIDQFLAGRKRLELAAAEVKRLRQVASIEYVGEFKRN